MENTSPRLREHGKMNEKVAVMSLLVGYVAHFYPLICGTITRKKGRQSTAHLINVSNIYKYDAANIS